MLGELGRLTDFHHAHSGTGTVLTTAEAYYTFATMVLLTESSTVLDVTAGDMGIPPTNGIAYTGARVTILSTSGSQPLAARSSLYNASGGQVLATSNTALVAPLTGQTVLDLKHTTTSTGTSATNTRVVTLTCDSLGGTAHVAYLVEVWTQTAKEEVEK